MDLRDIKGIGPATEDNLNDAGITSVEELASADVAELAEATGISEARLQDFQDQAAEAGGPGEEAEPEEAEPEVSPDTEEEPEGVEDEEAGEEEPSSVQERVDELKVVLQDRARRARVLVGDTWHENVPIVTAKINESAERKMQQVKENAVLLKEKARTAYVRVEDKWHENVPIFREREKSGGVVEETRVEVDEIREQPQEEPGFLDRVKNLFKR